MKNKLLVIEDDADTLELVKEVLEEAGFFVVGAPTASTGIAAAQILKFDGIITDLCLMDIPVEEMLHHFVEMGLNTPVMIISACLPFEIEIARRKTNARCTLAKPFNTQTLIDSTRYLLKPSAIAA